MGFLQERKGKVFTVCENLCATNLLCSPIVCGTSCVKAPIFCATTKICLSTNASICPFGTDGSRGITVRGTCATSAGIELRGGNNTWHGTLYGAGSTYGFLDSTWGGWDIQKIANGDFSAWVGASGFLCVMEGGLRATTKVCGPIVCGTTCVQGDRVCASNCMYSGGCVRSPKIEAQNCIILGSTTIIQNGNVGYMKICGSGDNHMVIGPANDNGWGYIESCNNASGMYFGTNQGSFLFDTGSLGAYTDGEVDVGFSGRKFRNINITGTSCTPISRVSCTLYDQNYGHGAYGLYCSTKFQHVWSMGTAYKQAVDGSGLGSLYGLSWTHTNAGGESKAGLSHQLLVVLGGTVESAIGCGMWTSAVSYAGSCFISPVVCATTAFRGTHCGNGASLTSLNASNLSSGTVATARLPAAALCAGNVVNGQACIAVTCLSSQLKSLRFATGAQTHPDNTDYTIFRGCGAWSGVHPDLVINFHTGIRFGAHISYQGFRFFCNSSEATAACGTCAVGLLFSIGKGDAHTRVHCGNFYSCNLVQSPIAYFSNYATIKGTGNNSGKSDFTVHTGGNPSMALSGGEFRVGSDDVNWSVAVRRDGDFSTYGQPLNLRVVEGNRNINFIPSGTGCVCTAAIFCSNTCVKSPILCATSCLESAIIRGPSGKVCVACGSYYQLFCPTGSWAHFITNSSYNYFSSPVVVDSGCVSSYNEDLWLRRVYGGPAAHTIRIADGVTTSCQQTYICNLVQSPIVCATSCVYVGDNIKIQQGIGCSIVNDAADYWRWTLAGGNNRFYWHTNTADRMCLNENGQLCTTGAMCSPIVCATSCVRSNVLYAYGDMCIYADAAHTMSLWTSGSDRWVEMCCYLRVKASAFACTCFQSPVVCATTCVKTANLCLNASGGSTLECALVFDATANGNMSSTFRIGTSWDGTVNTIFLGDSNSRTLNVSDQDRVGIGHTSPLGLLHLRHVNNDCVPALITSHNGATSGSYGAEPMWSRKWLLHVTTAGNVTQNDANSKIIRLQLPASYSDANGASGTIKIAYYQGHAAGHMSFEYKFGQYYAGGTTTYSTWDFGTFKIQKIGQLYKEVTYLDTTKANYIKDNIKFYRHVPASGTFDGQSNGLVIKIPNSGTSRVVDISVEIEVTGRSGSETFIKLQDLGTWTANAPSGLTQLTPTVFWLGTNNTDTICTSSNVCSTCNFEAPVFYASGSRLGSSNLLCGATCFHADGDSRARFCNVGTNAIALYADSGDELYLASNNGAGGTVRLPSAGGLDASTGVVKGPIVCATSCVAASKICQKTGDNYLNLYGGCSNPGGILIHDCTGANRGYVYFDGTSNFGLLTCAGGWGLRLIGDSEARLCLPTCIVGVLNASAAICATSCVCSPVFCATTCISVAGGSNFYGRLALRANDTNNSDDIDTSTGSLGAFEVYNNGAGHDAFFAFHIGGQYATYFGLDSANNRLAVGGWSSGANKYNLTCDNQGTFYTTSCLCSPIVCASSYIKISGTKLTSRGNTSLNICGSGDNSVEIGPNNDNSWGYLMSCNNSAGWYIYTNQGNFLFDGGGHLGSYDDGETDVGYTSHRFRCGYFSDKITLPILNSTTCVCSPAVYGTTWVCSAGRMVADTCVQSPIVCATSCVKVGATKLFQQASTRLGICGTGDNYMMFGPNNDDSWGYVESINNSSGIYFNTNQGNFLFDTASLGSYTDGEVDIGFSGRRFRCGYFSNNICGNCFYGLGMCSSQCIQTPIVCSTNFICATNLIKSNDWLCADRICSASCVKATNWVCVSAGHMCASSNMYAGACLISQCGLYGAHASWSGEQNKIRWHSTHLYFQNTSSGYLGIFRRADGGNRLIIVNSGGLCSMDYICAVAQICSATRVQTPIVCATSCIMLGPTKMCNSVGFTVIDSTEGTLIRDNSANVFEARASGNKSFVNLHVCGSLSKASGCFSISHPDPAKNATHNLQHAFVESPTEGDNIYRWQVQTTAGTNVITLPTYYRFLNKNDMVWVSPYRNFGSAYGEVTADQCCLIVCSNQDGCYNVLLIGTRKDEHAESMWTGAEVLKPEDDFTGVPTPVVTS